MNTSSIQNIDKEPITTKGPVTKNGNPNAIASSFKGSINTDLFKPQSLVPVQLGAKFNKVV
jgi:hypothetical protein